MTSAQVLDLSHWNTVQSFAEVAAAGILGVIHKASEGDYNTDGTYAGRRAEAEAAGLLWGAYHFGTDADVGRQVSRFLGAVDDTPDMLLALDFEDYGANSMSLEQARDFIERVEAATGRGVVLYSGNRIKEQLGSDVDPWWGARRLWLAQYASAPTLPASWESYWLWQYTDTGRVPGISGDVDCNHFEGRPKRLGAEWSGAAEAPAPPEPRPEPGPETETVTITITVKVTAATVGINVESS